MLALLTMWGTVELPRSAKARHRFVILLCSLSFKCLEGSDS